MSSTISTMADNLPPTFVPGFHDEAAVRRMKYKTLGNTGLQVSHIGLGGTGFSSLFGKYEEADAIEVVRSALKAGINYIDTAPYYGLGSSEELLGKALKGVPREAYYIATKVGRYDDFDYSAQRTLDSVEISLKRLGLDHVDIIQIHDIEFPENIDEVLSECLPTLQEKVVKAGKARFIGVTGYPVSILKECIERSRVRINSIITYARFTLIDDTLNEYLPFFEKHDIAVINAASGQMGLLSNNGPQPWHPAHKDTKEICRKAGEYCKARGVELGRLALYYSLNKQPGPIMSLIGMNDMQILKINLEVVCEGISDAEKKVLNEVQEKFFSNVVHRHWEGTEVSAYRKKNGLKYP